MDAIDIRTVWTDTITRDETEAFCRVVNAVFGNFCTEEYFTQKYLHNIYGPSAIILAYQDGQPVGACSLWRNDIGGREAYQAADASVLADHRKQGVYTAMLQARHRIAEQRGHVLLYTYPNPFSFPLLTKAGWQHHTLRKALFLPGITPSAKVPAIDSAYAAWWLRHRQDICRITRLGHHYLVKTLPLKGVARVLGTIDEDAARQFPTAPGPLFLLYRESRAATLLNRRLAAIPVAYRNADDPQIPFWKMDSI